MSESIFEKNMEVLREVSERTSSYIEDKIKQYEIDKEYKPVTDDKETFAEKGMVEDINIVVERAYDDAPIFRVKKGNVNVYLNGRRGPGKIAEEWTECFDQLPRTAPIFMFGIGNGSFLLEIHKRVKEDVRIFIYEPSFKIFIKCIEEVDLTEVLKKREVFIGLDDNISYDQIKGIVSDYITMANMEFSKRYVLPGYANLYPKEVKKYLQLIKQPMDNELTDHATRATFSNILVATMLYNSLYLPDCNTTYQLAHVIPRDIPAIIVAAGPSLNKNIKELKKAQGKAFIIAVDTAVRPLLREGIVPDMFAVVDATKPVELVNIDGAESIPLVTSIVSAQEVLAFHTGKKFFYDEGYRFIDRAFEENGIEFKDVARGGSVATIAFSLAYMVGIDNIILVGQDLALTGNKTHADGTFKDEMDEIDTSKMEMVPGNVEPEVPTRHDFKMYRDWYEYYIKGCQRFRPDLKVINATEGGAKIEGTVICTLEEAIKDNCKREVDIKALINGIKPIFDKEKRENVVRYLHAVEGGFKDIASKAESQHKIYKKIENMARTGGLAMKEYRKLLLKLRKMNKEMIKSPLYDLVDMSLIDARLALEKELLVEEDSMLEEAKEISRKGLLYMDLVKDCALLFSDVAKASVSNAR